MQLLSVFVGRPTAINHQGKTVSTAIYKKEVAGPVKVNLLNIEGDQQVDLTVHGGINKAVYAYPLEHYTFWKSQRPDLEFQPGIFGENLSVSGLNEKAVSIGDTYQIGSCVFTVTSPRLPCFKLGIKMGDPKFVKEFLQAVLTGFYFRVITEGTIEAGNSIEKVNEDGYNLTVDEVVRLYSVDSKNQTLLEKAIKAPSLPADWKEFFEKKLSQL